MKQVSEFKYKFRGDIQMKTSGGHLTTPYAGPCDRTSEDGFWNRITFRDLNVYTATDTGLWVVCNNYEVLPVPYLERGESRGVLT